MIRILEDGELRLWTTCSGTGVPMILCNGGPGCDDYLGPVAEMVEGICTVVRFEPRGCGRSSRDGCYDFETTVSDVERVRRAYGFPRVIIAGHSAGANVALGYAMRHPGQVVGIVGIAGGSIVNDREWNRKYREGLETFGEDTGRKPFDADEAVNKIGNATWRQYITRAGLLKDLSAIEVPVVFINAERDIRPNWPTRQIARLLKRGRYVEIAGARHYVWLTHGAELAAEIRKALKEIVESMDDS